MLRRYLTFVEAAILRRPRAVLAGSLVLAAVGAFLGAGVELHTSRSELAPADDPDQRRFDELLDDYKGSQVVVACVEAEPGRSATAVDLDRFADRLAERLSADPLVERVFHRIDTDWLLDRALYLVPPAQLRAIATAVEGERGELGRLATLTDLAALNRALAERIEHGFGAAVPGLDAAPRALALLSALFAAERRFIEDAPAAVADWVRRPLLPALAGSSGRRLEQPYPQTYDGRTRFLLVTPRATGDSLPVQRGLIGALRADAEAARAATPGFHVAFTGTAAMSVEEMDTVRSDTWHTSVVAVAGVALLTLAVFRWRTHALLVLVALGVGLAWAFGAVRLELGYLNLITSSFVATLVGVGVAYGIHPVSEYELEGAHTIDPLVAVRESFRRTGPAVAVAGITTAVAFFSILLMRFRGFAELGLVAGVGVLLCLAAALVALPALLVLYGHWRRARDRERREVAPLDRLWLERAAGRICTRPLAVTLAAGALTAAAASSAVRLGFDSNILDLLPADAESVRYQKKMALESDLSPVFNLVVADDAAELDEMRKRAEREPAIARFESVLGLLPGDSTAAREAVAAAGAALDAIELPGATTPLDAATLEASLRGLERALARALDAAFTAGIADVVGPLEDARGAAAGAAEAAHGASAERVVDWNRGQERLRSWLGEGVEGLKRAARAGEPSPENLPSDVREQFFTRSGRWLGFLYPSGSVFDTAALDAYVAASRRVSESAIGFPYMLHKMSGRITTGFYRAVAAGAVVVLLVLLVDLRRARDAALAATPLAIGIVWTLGAMAWLGRSFNFANLVAVPLIIGVGIDNGVHVIHRFRLEGEAGMTLVLRHTGRAILIASLTTMIGFGSLLLASHRGLSGLGLLLVLGVGSCLVSSMVVLPNLMILLGLAKR